MAKVNQIILFRTFDQVMAVRKTEILVVGQGLAGSILAHALRRQEADFLVIGKPDLSLSSRIAAGIWNPVVFKRMTGSWKAREVIPAMHSFFSEAEQFLHASFFSPRKMMKFFSEQQEAELWLKKSRTELAGFVDEKIYAPHELDINGVQRPLYGFSFVTGSGNVDTNVFMDVTRRWLRAAGRFSEEYFDHAALQSGNGKFIYKDIEAQKIIFCEGWLNHKNPFFSYIPFKPAKGEVLTFHCEQLSTPHILNKGVFVLPLQDHRFRCGATYEWSGLDDDITEAKQQELEEKLQRLIALPYTVTHRHAGVRPAVIDRRPAMGKHPSGKELYIFNGFGTKAIMLAPFFAMEMLNFVAGKEPLSPGADISRFLKHYPS